MRLMRSVRYVMVSLFAVGIPPGQRSEVGRVGLAVRWCVGYRPRHRRTRCRAVAIRAGRRVQTSWRLRSVSAWAVDESG